MNQFEKVILPIHMKAALDKSLDEFAKMGFHYDISSREDLQWDIKLMIDSTVQHAIALGIKIGYNLARENNPS